MSDIAAALERLGRLDRGREAFRTLVARWMAASGWAYSTLAELAEYAVTETEAAGIPPFSGSERAGDVFSCNGHVWRALVDLDGEQLAPIYSNATKSTPDWDKSQFEHVASLRRLFPSQANNLVRGYTQNCYAITFDVLGSLNEWLSSVKRGRRPIPTDERLAEAVNDGVVIEDEEGLFGPEEFLALYLGLIDLPKMFSSLSQQEADAMSAGLGQLIRQAMAAAGLDLVSDWAKFIAGYPTSSTARRRTVQEVALGLAKWPTYDVQNEEAAVKIACRRLLLAHGKDPAILDPEEKAKSIKPEMAGAMAEG